MQQTNRKEMFYHDVPYIKGKIVFDMEKYA